MQLLYVPSSALTFYVTSKGQGRHFHCMGMENISKILQYSLVYEVLYIYAVTFARVSVAIMVNRLFGVSRRITNGLYAYTAFMFVCMITTSSLLPAACQPRSKWWNPMAPGSCWSRKDVLAIGYVNGGMQTGTGKSKANSSS